MARFSVRKLAGRMLGRSGAPPLSRRSSSFVGRLEELEVRDVPATFYVATSGSDSATGDSAHPFKTIQHAADLVQAGDTVIVRAGTYAGFILGWDFTTAGTATAPITFEADPGAATGSVVINAKNAYTGVGIDIEPGCSYITIKGFDVDGTNFATVGSRFGIKITGDHDAVIGNTVHDFFDVTAGIHSNGADNTLIEGNTVYNIGANGNGAHGHGVYIADGDGIVVRGNTLYNNEFIGLHINGDPNVVSHALIENNVIYNNGQNAINADGLQSSTIQNNLLYGFARTGITLYKIDSSGSPTNNLIINNTIVSTKSGASSAIRIVDGGTGNTILNNVLLGGGGVSLTMSSDSLSGTTSDYNVFGSFKNDDTGGTQTLTQWRSSSSQDAHSFNSTLAALFADPTNNDYHLSSTSSAIDKGTSTNAPSTDIEGTSRPSSGIDIGAYEYASTSSATATHFSVAVTLGAIAGTSFSVTVTALTSSNSTDTGYTGTVRVTSNDTLAGLPADYTFTASDAGTHTFSVTLKTAGSKSVTATDTTTGSITGSASVSVSAATASSLQLSAPSSATAGTAFNVTATLKDAYGNVATGYRGTVSLVSSDGQAVLPLNYTFTASDAGTHTFNVTLKTAGSQTVTLKDTTNSSLTATTAGINVSAATASVFQVSAPSSATAGTAFNVTVTAKDAYGNVATGYRGTVRLASSDGQAVLPLNYTFTASDAGTHTFSVTLKTAGTQTVSAIDTMIGSITGTASVSVLAATGDSLQVLLPQGSTSGTAVNATVTVRDAFGNVATGYRGTVHFTSSDGAAVLPADYTFTTSDAGTHTFSVTLKSTGTQTVTITDTVTGSITASATVSVSAVPVPLPPPPAPAPLPLPPAPAPAPRTVPVAPIVINASVGSQVVRVLNPDGSVARALTPHPGFTGGIVAGAGDVNGDGVADIATVATYGGHVKLFDGATGAELWSFYGYVGYSGAISIAVGDVNGDGRADVLISANANGHVKVFDGRTGDNTVSYLAYPGFIGTVALSTADVNGDGKAELLTAADAGAGVHVKAVDPFSGALTASFMATPPGPVSTFSLSAGDLDGDGVAEFLVSTGSRVRVLDGVTKGVRGDFDAFPGFTGRVTVEAAQADGDGLPELVAVAESATNPQVKVFDGPAGNAIKTFFVS